jgi:cysteinyl-tRNA synthetase
MLSTHYRAPLNFSGELIESTTKELNKMEAALKQANLTLSINNNTSQDINQDIMDRFMANMEDDLNTSNALTIVFDTLKALNQELRNKELNTNKIASLKTTIERMLAILGVFIDLKDISNDDLTLYNQWNEAKQNKDFAVADKYREQLVKIGIL